MRPLMSYTIKWYMYKHASVLENETLNVLYFQMVYVQHASVLENETLNILYFQMVYVQTRICPREWDP